ncbi:uncharacterized protein PG986_000127 [Apiospora aurea]|uniref:Uncharacterized protein n=1 Tax=Apiospora aurea TaxID=335848 RepID=A0ABR1QUR1_9PEZI
MPPFRLVQRIQPHHPRPRGVPRRVRRHGHGACDWTVDRPNTQPRRVPLRQRRRRRLSSSYYASSAVLAAGSGGPAHGSATPAAAAGASPAATAADGRLLRPLDGGMGR